MKHYLIVFTLFVLAACQSTDHKDAEQTTALKIKPYKPKPVVTNGLDNIPISQVEVEEKKVTETTTQSFSTRDNKGNKPNNINEKASVLLNQQACRDNVKVTYRVLDQNAISGIYHANVQAQGVILSLSEDQKDIKLRTTGWYTTNQNLNKWQPYLTKSPLAEDILLKTDAEFWDNKKHWYLCGVR